MISLTFLVVGVIVGYLYAPQITEWIASIKKDK